MSNQKQLGEGVVELKLVNSDDVALVSEEDYGHLLRFKWFQHKAGYAYRAVSERYEFLHRRVMGCLYGDGRVVDHINLNKLDNRRENLRLVTHKFNAQNRLTNKRNTSGYVGVTKFYDQWQARIRKDGKIISLGVFDDIEDAAKARKAGIEKYHAYHGTIQEDL